MLSRPFLIGILITAICWAQQNPFPKASYFRETFSKPITRVELKPPVRLEDFVVDGKLELSLRSYLELVLANNTDVQISRLTVETAKNAILRGFGAFDPLFTGAFTATRQLTPASDILAGAATVSQLSQPAVFNYQQRLETGTTYTVGYSASKLSTNSAFQTWNPSLSSNVTFRFTQPLIRDRGTFVNRLPIMTARSRLRATEYTLRDTLMRLLSDAESVYWDVLQARENLRVQQSALELADFALKRANQELQLGATSPLEIFQPQQNYATVEIQVSQARFLLGQREDALRRQIGADLDPQFRHIAIQLTESLTPPLDSAAIDAESAVEAALVSRPDLRAAIQNLDVDDLGIKQAANAMKPDLSLTGRYVSQGRGGDYYTRDSSLGGSTTNPMMIPGGFGDALNMMFGFGFPIYELGVTLRLPIRDRAAAANMADAQVAKRRDTLTARSLEQTVRLDVLNAVNQVESSKASVKLATVARDFAQKRLDAEQKKYDLGTSQIFFVLQAQTDRVNAESSLVRETVTYRRNLLNLLRRTGQLLEERGVVVE